MVGLSVDITRCPAAAASRGRGGLLAKRSPAQVAEFLEDGDSRTPEDTERGSRVSQCYLNRPRERMTATEHAPRDPFYLLKRLHALAKIVECGAGVLVERPRVNFPHRERVIMRISKDASRHGHRSAQQRLGFFKAL